VTRIPCLLDAKIRTVVPTKWAMRPPKWPKASWIFDGVCDFGCNKYSWLTNIGQGQWPPNGEWRQCKPKL
jgi:hypothetical protein